MSNPANQLAKYRSYSYYHVVAICDSSKTATELAGETILDVWQHSQANSKLGKYGVKTTMSGGRYVILINGSTDAEFTITKTSWTSMTASAATLNDRNTSISLEGQISISEPRGVIFLNQVVQCCIELGVDSANAFWVLKTFFVGFTYDTNQDTDGADFINDIPPVIFIAYDVTGNFTIVGGEYEISFLAAANSAARLPQYSKSASAAHVAPAGSISDTLAALQIAVQKNYDNYFGCVLAQTSANPSTADIVSKLRRVEYIITCDPPYLNNEQYTTTDQAAQLKNFGPTCAPGAVSIPPGMSIDDAIHKIIDMCPEIKNEANVGVGGKKYTTKITNWLYSFPDAAGGIQYQVGYRLIRQEQPTSVSFESIASGNAPSSPNLITFDYLYTGKNIDILELDLKMNMGMVYLQGATIQNHYKQPGQDVAITATSVNGEGVRRSNSQNIPIFFGTQIKSANIRDTKDVNTAVQHAYSMSKHASLEMLETTIKITGNSQLLGSINKTTDPEFIKSRAVQPDKQDGYARFSEWALSPSFVKVNIKMPRNNNDESLFTGSQTSADSSNTSSDFAVDFWYQGYYYVYSIEHVFDNGEFYQVMSALAIPEKSTFDSVATKPSAENIDIDKLVDQCYENFIGCGSSSSAGTLANSTVVYPEAHDSVSTSTANQTAADTTTATRNLSNIRGYDSASPVVKKAIHNAAVNNGVDEFALAQICAVETGSTFNPNSAYHKSGQPPSPNGAKGLFQFVGPTWRSFGGGDIFDPELNADRGAKYFAQNRDALAKTLGRDPTTSEVYLAHNQGLGGATGVIKLIESGNGASQAKLTNPAGNNIFDTSANGAMLWAKNIVGSRLVNGAPYDSFDIMQKRSNKDALSSVRSCGEGVGSSIPSPSPSPPQLDTNNCGVRVPIISTPDTSTTGKSKQPGPFADKPRDVVTPVDPLDWNGLNINSKPTDEFTLGSDKYVDKIPKFNINDNPVPEVVESKPTPKFKRFV